MSAKRYTVEDEIYIVNPDGEEVCEVSSIDSDDCCAELNALLERAEKAEADCKAMAAALSEVPSTTTQNPDGSVDVSFGVHYCVIINRKTFEAIRRWRP